MPHLIALSGPLTGLVLPLDPPEQILGREPGVGLLLPDDAISRKHCKLVQDDGRWRVQDLGSLNATFVNGAQIKDHPLEDGDEIRIGESTLRFVEAMSEIIAISRSENATLLVEPDALFRSKPSVQWRADRLDDLLRLYDHVAGARRPLDVLELTGSWLTEVLRAGQAAIYHRHRDRLRVVHEHRVGDAAERGSIILDAAAIDKAVEAGQTVWLSEPGILIAPLDGPPATYLAVVRAFKVVPSESDVQLIACAARMVGSTLQSLHRMEHLQRAVEDARLVIDDDHEIITNSQAMVPVVQLLERVAPTESTVMIQGESGSGKELVARAIHVRSSRAAGPFVAVNCAALPEPLIESELFGHEKGAFTGAIATRQGRFERANGGTLFLDEIGDMSTAAQVRLLRVLEERKVQRVGGTELIDVDVRVVAATNRDLSAMVEEGTFRQDLYYRLAVVQLKLPPLRSRPEDIPALAAHLLRQSGEQMGRSIDGFDDEALAAMKGYSWPGNVRELRNAIEHAVAVGSGEQIGVEDLPAYIRSPQPSSPERLRLPASLRDVEQAAVAAALEATGGNKSKAARMLGIDRGTLYAKIRLYGLEGGSD